VWTYIEKTDIEKFINKYSFLAEIFEEICLYQTEDKIFLPRLFNVNYSDYTKIFESRSGNFCPTFFKFTGTLREEQVDIVNFVLNSYENNNSQINGIIKARPGLGKTILSVYLAAKLGIKTCVVLDNDNILSQWVSAFLNFTDLNPDEIGLIKGKYCVLDRPVIIATVQTLLSKIKTDMYKNFQLIDSAGIGLVFYDEVHNTSSSSKYAKASLLFRTKNVIGLSATPFQTGISEVLMKNTIGEIIYETKHYDLKPTYVMNHYDSGLTQKYSYALGRKVDYIKRKSFYNSIIVKSPQYLRLIINLTKQRLTEGHRVLILVFTKAQIKLISEELTNEGIEHRRFYGDEKTELDKENVMTVLATYSYAGKGFDFEQLSSLILGTNLAGKKSLIQVVGRILRIGDKHKKAPVVDDLIDNAFPSMFIPDMQKKQAIIKNEFGCQIQNKFYNDI
jgi:superfamily II DNA or RNA helicase